MGRGDLASVDHLFKGDLVAKPSNLSRVPASVAELVWEVGGFATHQRWT